MSLNMYFARTTDSRILEETESGGAVTSLLRFLLETGKVDGVVATKAKNGNRYAGVPVLITEPEKLNESTGSLHCSIPNIPRFVKEYLDGASKIQLAVVGKPCDIRAIIELHKREQIDLDNLILIGLNCTGTISPATAKQMFIDEFKVNPNEVISEDIDEGKLSVFLEDGNTKALDLMKLEEKGYGRRENCRRCEINIPIFADLACGKWGCEEEESKTTFIEACSNEGILLIEEAIENGYITADEPDKKSIQRRAEKDRAEKEIAKLWRERDFKPILGLDRSERLNYWLDEFSKCIKCYGCRDACPICYCDHCLLEADRGFLEGGEIPPDTVFPLTRLAHVADSCVNCGQCQDACPMELPLSKLFSLLNAKLNEVFDYIPGLDATQKQPMSNVVIEELQVDDTFLDIPSMNKALGRKASKTRQ
ncbi:MAG: Coenzyme F420 hydrogenase/dehydrogenase, beta subunit C-terminal domain [Candidatus Thorarchaeota archaeon]